MSTEGAGQWRLIRPRDVELFGPDGKVYRFASECLPSLLAQAKTIKYLSEQLALANDASIPSALEKGQWQVDEQDFCVITHGKEPDASQAYTLPFWRLAEYRDAEPLAAYLNQLEADKAALEARVSVLERERGKLEEQGIGLRPRLTNAEYKLDVAAEALGRIKHGSNSARGIAADALTRITTGEG